MRTIISDFSLKVGTNSYNSYSEIACINATPTHWRWDLVRRPFREQFGA